MVDLPVNVILSLKDALSGALNGAKSALQGFDSATQGSTKNFNALGEAMSTAAGVMIRDLARGFTETATRSLTLGAEIESLTSAFDAMRTNAGSMTLSLEGLREATRGTVADVDLLTAANQAMALGLPVDDIDQLFASAMKLGRAMGIDTLNAVNSLATGIGRQSKLILDNLGVTFQASEAYDWFAQKIGVSTSELDENQKKLAWQQYAIEEVTRRAEELGEIQDEAKTKQEQWNASLTNFQTALGQTLAPLSGFKGVIDGLLPILTTVASTVLAQMISKFGLLGTASKILGSTLGQVAISAGAAIGAFTIVYTILQTLDPATREMAAVLSILVGVFIAITAAAIAAWTAVSWGAALPVILAGVGAAVAGVMVLMTDAGVSADNFGNSLVSVGDKAKALENTIDESMVGQTQTIKDELAEQTEVTTLHYDDLIQEEKDYYKTVYDDMVTSYDDQIAEVKNFYDEMVGTAKIALQDIRDNRRDDLNDLELNYLLKRQATKAAYESGQIDKETYETEMEKIEKVYRDRRSEITESYRIDELKAEIEFNDAEKIAKTDGKEAIETLEQKKKENLEKINNDLKNKIIELETEKNMKIEAMTNIANSKIEGLTNSYASKVESRIASMKNSVIGSYQAMNLAAMAAIETSGGSGLSTYSAGLPTGGYRPVYQHGGIATYPQLAYVAEAEPELIIPMSKLQKVETPSRSVQTINVYPFIHIGNVSREIPMETIEKLIENPIKRAIIEAKSKEGF